MKAIAKFQLFLIRMLFTIPKRLICLEQIQNEACVHLSFGANFPKIGGYRALINDSLLLSGHKIVRIGARASADVFWVVSGLEETPWSVEKQTRWLERIIREAPDQRVAIYLSNSREGRRLKRNITLKNVGTGRFNRL